MLARMRSWGGLTGSSASVADTRIRSATAFSDALWPIAPWTRVSLSTASTARAPRSAAAIPRIPEPAPKSRTLPHALRSPGTPPASAARHSLVVGWSPVPNPVPGSITSVVGASADEVWAAASQGGRIRPKPGTSIGPWLARNSASQSWVCSQRMQLTWQPSSGPRRAAAARAPDSSPNQNAAVIVSRAATQSRSGSPAAASSTIALEVMPAANASSASSEPSWTPARPVPSRNSQTRRRKSSRDSVSPG